MRKICFLLPLLFLSLVLRAQVSATQTRNALLEVFTGISCGWCPEGDVVSAHLAHAYPGRVLVVDVHAGSYASPGTGGPDYRTAPGDSLHNHYEALAGGIGYPSALVSREDWDNSWIIGRTYWPMCTEEIINTPSAVELQATAQYDGSTRLLTVNVDGTCLSDTLEGNLRLGVVLTQDGIIGPQNGTTKGDAYEHNHVLRACLTSIFGDSIGTAAENGQFHRDYTYTLPAEIKGVATVPEDMNIIVFLADATGKIEQAVGIKPQYNHYAETLAGQLSEPDIPIGNRYGYHFFEVQLKNKSAKALTSASFDVTVNGETTNQETTVDIAPFATAAIRIPASYTYAAKGRTKYSIVLKQLNGEPVDPDTLEGAFSKPKVVGSMVTLQMMTDNAAHENHFYLKDADGQIVKEFGPFADGVAATYYDTISVEDGKTYCVEVTDMMGDGLNSGKRGGLITRSASGSLIDQYYQINGYGVRSFFIVDNAAGISSPEAPTQPSVIYTIDGRKTNAANHPGLYIKRVGTKTTKIIIH